MPGGLLDWLTEAMGNSAGPGSTGNPNSYPNNPPPPGTGAQFTPPPMPPVQQTGDDTPPPQIPPSTVPPMPFGGNRIATSPPPGGLSVPPLPPGQAPNPQDIGTDPMGAPTGFPTPPPPQTPQPPPGPEGLSLPPGMGATPPPVRPGGIGSDAARAPNQPPLPPVPLPMARPPGAGPGANQLGERTTPPEATSTEGGPNTAIGKQVQQAGQEVNWLGKLLGVNTPEEAKRAGREISRGMAAAFANAPSGVGKGKFAAFAGGVGAGMKGSQAEADREEENQRKYIAQKILANNSNLTGQLNIARTKLALEQAKAVMTGQGSQINSPQQLYLRAQALANNDADVKKARMDADALVQKQGYKPDSPEAKAAEEKFQKLLTERRAHHMGAVGLDPKLGETVGKLPGLSKETALSGDKLNQTTYDNLPVGGYFIDPGTKKLMRKPPAPGTAAPAAPPTAAPPTAAPPTTAGTPPTPPAPVTAPAGSRAAAEDEDADTDVG